MDMDGLEFEPFYHWLRSLSDEQKRLLASVFARGLRLLWEESEPHREAARRTLGIAGLDNLGIPRIELERLIGEMIETLAIRPNQLEDHAQRFLGPMVEQAVRDALARRGGVQDRVGSAASQSPAAKARARIRRLLQEEFYPGLSGERAAPLPEQLPDGLVEWVFSRRIVQRTPDRDARQALRRAFQPEIERVVAAILGELGRTDPHDEAERRRLYELAADLTLGRDNPEEPVSAEQIHTVVEGAVSRGMLSR